MGAPHLYDSAAPLGRVAHSCRNGTPLLSKLLIAKAHHTMRCGVNALSLMLEAILIYFASDHYRNSSTNQGAPALIEIRYFVLLPSLQSPSVQQLKAFGLIPLTPRVSVPAPGNENTHLGQFHEAQDTALG